LHTLSPGIMLAVDQMQHATMACDFVRSTRYPWTT
jgi:hypothetical protein